ncbi:MAG: ABC transporter substrate-binding protein [Deltaproteobacteria bacterium]|uniref:ABC transporter substrate-binding protein n=1 Tax=Desulfobacula sp. TaxID=2593537 RepID=UPI0019C3C9E3|nr:ABC transporter substrate-binding protein [Candidatus Desulfobacula maris]MBL6993067.1 ABC transporter substrate-binding protein [Desulfobacula sp.]
MGKNKFSLLLILFILLSFIQYSFASDKFSIKPIKKNNTQKYKIGYLEGGKYSMYPTILKGIVGSLAELGWIEQINIPDFEDPTDSSKLWHWISKNIKSDYIEFVDNAYWSSGWKSELRTKNKSEIIKRLNNKKDIDLIIANGTWAGQDLANNEHSVPTIVCSTSNPIQAKIIISEQDSGFSHVHARVDPTRFQRQISLFHDIVGFEKLGIAYIDTVVGRSYAAVEDIEAMASQLGFKVEKCLLPDKVEGQKLIDMTVECHKKLAQKVDAVYITVQTGVTLKSLPQLMKPLTENEIPTFSQGGSNEVKHGVLMSISQANYKYISMFHAETIAKVFNGAAPGDLVQVFEDPPKIAINIAEAEKIGFNPSVDILSAADEIFNEIEVAE